MDQLPSKAGILAALSQALDLVEGQGEGHALRTCLISLRLGKTFKLQTEDLEDLYFSAVLKDSGCTNNAVRIHQIFGGDELISKRKVKFVDWSSPLQSLKFAIQNTEAGNTVGAKLRRMAQNVASPTAVMNEVTRARCTRGAFIAQKLNFRTTVADAILCLDEHWDGHGAPTARSGTEIPLIARIVCLAQTFDVFLTAYGLEAAREVVKKRSKKWFDPDLSRAIVAIKDSDPLWKKLTRPDLQHLVTSEVPWLATAAMDVDVDGICEAFAMIIDAKSSLTAKHSERVAEYAVNLATWFGYSPEAVRTVRRGCLVHDIGKLGISTSILEKPGGLEPVEFEAVKMHPKLADTLLRRIPTFDKVADIASSHHERLDGRGYWQGLAQSQLSRDVRIATACDVFDALTADRPYREGMPLDRVFEIMDKDTNTAFDPDCVQGLKECYGAQSLERLAA